MVSAQVKNINTAWKAWSRFFIRAGLVDGSRMVVMEFHGVVARTRAIYRAYLSDKKNGLLFPVCSCF